MPRLKDIKMGKGGALRVDATSEALREGVKAPPLFTPLDLASFSLTHTHNTAHKARMVFSNQPFNKGKKDFGARFLRTM